ncbi:MAG: hypothetical protein JWQ98_2655 [Chlorobi bacterium]|nr:hypothetical protein [Chlorobiota bacterium]
MSYTGFRRGCALLLLAAAVIAGCGDSTSPSDSSIAPPTGARLMTYNYTLDGFRRLGQGDSSSVSVKHDSANVVTFSSRTRVPMSIDYLPNGDLSVRQPAFRLGAISIREHWLQLPFGTKVPLNVTLLDTAYNSGGGVDSLRVTWATNFTGPDVTVLGPQNFLVIGSETFNAIRTVATQSIRLKHSGTGVPADQTTITEITDWYAPSIGAIVQEETYFYIDKGQGRVSSALAKGWVATSYAPN